MQSSLSTSSMQNDFRGFKKTFISYNISKTVFQYVLSINSESLTGIISEYQVVILLDTTFHLR